MASTQNKFVKTEINKAVENQNIAASEGVSLDELMKFQSSKIEISKNAEYRASELAGVSNVVSMSNGELTAKVAHLEYVVNYLLARLAWITNANGLDDNP